MAKNIYLVQASAVYGESVKTAYLPYAAGCLASYAFDDSEVAREYSFGRFVYLREDIESAVESLTEPFLVGFSCYIWNMEYNKAFAKRLKEKYPSCITVFGGHSVSPDGSGLDAIPQADILIHGEGEEPFRRLLLALANGGDLAEVSNISYRDENNTAVTTQYSPPGEISAYPSPYLEGWFDGIIENGSIRPSVIWETNRGCPNKCAFCDWGALKAKVRHFPDERVKAELEWMVRNKIEYVYCADANFGLFERDTVIADMIVDYNRKTGWPKVFKTNYTKSRDDVVFEISGKLIDAGIGKSPTLSFQSLSLPVLESIGRSNMELEHFKGLMASYSLAGVPVYSELILGLPGETYDSFSTGISRLLECNQHTAIGIYPCELLPNSLMGSKEYIERFSIKTVHTPFSQYHCSPSQGGTVEYSDLVISTASMDDRQWKRSFIFSICVQAFHNLGLTRMLAMYLYNEKGITYKDFYERLIRWLSSLDESTVCGGVYAELVQLTQGIVDGHNSLSVPFGKNEIITWSYEEYVFLRLVEQYDEFSHQISEFMRGFDDGSGVIDDLVNYQLSCIKKPGIPEIQISCEHDFYDYFADMCSGKARSLEKRDCVVYSKGESADNFDEFARISVWYGRRDDAQLYIGNKNTVTVEYD